MADVYNFLFGTRAGLAVLFVVGIIVFIIAAFLLEKRTRSMYVDRGPAKKGEDEGLFSGLFGDDDEE